MIVQEDHQMIDDHLKFGPEEVDSRLAGAEEKVEDIGSQETTWTRWALSGRGAE